MRGKKGNKEVLKRILLCIRPYTSLVVLSLGLAVITVGLTLYVPILTGNAVDYIAGKGSVDFGMLGKLIVFDHCSNYGYGSSSVADESCK